MVGGATVAKAWRRQGIDTRLVARAIAWAGLTGVMTRLELSVLARYDPATRLCRAFGFGVEGRRRDAIYGDGECLDDLMTGLLPEEVGPGGSPAPSLPDRTQVSDG
mgnify:CR=1 FL=1